MGKLEGLEGEIERAPINLAWGPRGLIPTLSAARFPLFTIHLFITFYHHLSSVLHVLPSSPSSIPLHPSIQFTHSLWELPVSLHLLPSNPPPDQCSHSSASMIPLGDQPSLFPPTTTTQCKYIIQTSAAHVTFPPSSPPSLLPCLHPCLPPCFLPFPISLCLSVSLCLSLTHSPLCSFFYSFLFAFFVPFFHKLTISLSFSLFFSASL